MSYAYDRTKPAYGELTGVQIGDGNEGSSSYVYYHGEKWKEYGDEKIGRMFAHRSFLDAGMRVPGASDYTPGPFEPLMAIHKEILEWQAAHPNTTWLAWGITWLVILSTLFWPLC